MIGTLTRRSLRARLGRNVAILMEIAARNHLLKLQGHHSAREFARRLDEQLQQQADESDD